MASGTRSFQTKAEKLHERQPVAHLIRDLVVGQVVECAQHQRLEHHHGIQQLAPGPRLALRLGLAPDLLQRRTEFVPGHDGVDLDQRVTLGIKARVAV